mgnify:CR=1 FL=1
MKVVTSVTVFRDAVGMRMSITYSEVDDETGKIIKDNTRVDRVVTDQSISGKASELITYAQDFIED